jgi:hypothetical protein
LEKHAKQLWRIIVSPRAKVQDAAQAVAVLDEDKPKRRGRPRKGETENGKAEQEPLLEPAPETTALKTNDDDLNALLEPPAETREEAKVEVKNLITNAPSTAKGNNRAVQG